MRYKTVRWNVRLALDCVDIGFPWSHHERVRSLSLIAFVFLASIAPPTPPTFHLFFIGHEIGSETDTLVPKGSGTELQAVFHFLDRSTSVDLTGTLELADGGSPRHLAVKGRNYRLFSSDSEVTITADRAHVRDLSKETDI